MLRKIEKDCLVLWVFKNYLFTILNLVVSILKINKKLKSLRYTVKNVQLITKARNVEQIVQKSMNMQKCFDC